MGLQIRGKKLLNEISSARCENCKKIYDSEKKFCPTCGTELKHETLKIYANFGKNGITSFTCKLPNGITFNTRGTITQSIGKGISYTQKLK